MSRVSARSLGRYLRERETYARYEGEPRARQQACDDGEQLVCAADDGHRLSALQGLEPDHHDVGHTRPPAQKGLLLDSGVVQRREEASVGRAGAQCHNIHAFPPTLRRQGRAERQHEGLGGAVGRHVRHRLEGDRRGEIDDCARATGKHLRQNGVGQLDQGRYVHQNLGPLLSRVDLGERAVAAEAGVVEQQIAVQAELRHSRDDSGHGIGLLEVGGDDRRHDPVAGAEVLGQCLQLGGRAGDEDEVHPADGEGFGEGGADSAGGASNQGGLAAIGEGHGVRCSP